MQIQMSKSVKKLVLLVKTKSYSIAVAFISNVVYDTYFTIIFLAVPFS